MDDDERSGLNTYGPQRPNPDLGDNPREHRWSSYAANALGEADPLVSPHPIYRALGRGAAERQATYRALFRERLGDAFVEDLRNATNGGWALADAAFKCRIAKAAKRRAFTPRPATRRAGGSAADKSTLTPFTF